MRLLFLNHNSRNRGTYYRAMPMAEQLAQRGHEVTLLTVSLEHQWRATWSEINGVRLGEMPALGQENSGQGYGPLDNGRRLLHALLHRYDVVHMFDHKPNATFAGFAARWLRGAHLVSDWADWWGGPGGLNDVARRRIPAIGRFEAWWEEQSKRRADGVVAISTVLQQRAIELGCPPERVLYLPTGAAIDRIRPIPEGEARRRLGVPADRRIVGHIGCGGELAAIMAALRHLSDTWLMLIGPQNPNALEMARASGVADRLWEVGFVPDVEVGSYLACADVMVLPLPDTAANRGRLPNKLLDYMAAGRPTVAGPVGDVKRIIERYGVGLLAGPDDFAAVISRLLDNAELRVTLGRQARQTAEAEFDWVHLIDRLEAFYERLCQSTADKKGTDS